MKKEGAVDLGLLLISVLVLYHPAVSSGESSAGRRFAIGFPRNAQFERGAEELSISIANYGTDTVNFAINSLEFSYTGTLPTLTVTRVIIPLYLQVQFSMTERRKGILVEATGDVYVHGLSYGSITSDSYLALPCRAMLVNEYEYFAISYNGINAFPATILVVACDNGTSVTIGSTSITLNDMETYLISDNIADLTGTRITSSKPVSVFSGTDCSRVPTHIGACDHLVEQVPPTVTWGSRFLVSSLNGRNSSQLIRVLSARTANVTVTCDTAISVSQFQLMSGNYESFEIPPNSYCSIESTGPVLVAQYAYGYNTDNIGDPFMMIIPPTEQYLNRNIFETYSNFTSHITIYVASEFFQRTKIFLNNVIIPDWQPVPCSSKPVCGYITRMAVDPGVYRIRHQNTFATIGVSVYGFAETNSYGMPAGMGLSPIQGPLVIISPPVDQFVINNGSSAVFSCDTLAVPEHTVSWIFVNSSGTIIDIINGTKYSIVCDRNDSRFGELTVMSVTYEDRGVYTCTTVNSIGAVNASASLTVHARPILRDFSSLTEVRIGSPVVLVCESTGYPLPVISWSFEGKELNSSARLNIIEFFTSSINAISSNISELLVMYTSLSVERVSELGDLGVVSLLLFEETVRGDTGDYVCTATNMLPQTTTLSVQSGNIPLVILTIACPSLMAPVNGSVIYTSTANGNDSYALNSVATYICDTGFALVGVQTRTCTGEGSGITGAFDEIAPTCQVITCSELSDPVSGLVMFTGVMNRNENWEFGTEAVYNCNTGFSLVGNNTRACTGDGSSITGDFDGVAPTCQDIVCPQLSIPTSGSIAYIGSLIGNMYKFRTEAVYSCNTGFFLVGNASRICTGDGSNTTGAFDGVVPICEGPLVIIGPPVDQFVINNGSSAVFSCDTLAVPEHNVSWIFVISSGAIIDIITNTKYSILTDRNDSRFGELTVMSVTYEDRGVYTCTAVNIRGAVNASASLTVHVRPILRNFSSLTEVHLGSPVVLVCETTGYPLPVTSWNFNGEKLNTSARLNIIEFSTGLMNAISSNVSELLVMYTNLSVESVSELGDLGVVSLLLFEETVRGDTGDYVCTATNMLPQTTTLSVQSSNIPLVILGRPDPPNNVTVFDFGARWVGLRWTPSFDGNRPVTRFTLYISSVVNSNPISLLADDLISTGGGLIFNISMQGVIIPYTNYSFTLNSCNEIGCSNQSNPSPVIRTLKNVSVMIQPCLTGVDRCQQWVAENGRQKLKLLSEALSVNVEERCQCGFSVSNIFNPTFCCFPESENVVTYRAEVSGTVSTSSSQIVNHIEEWLTDGALVTFDCITIPINSSCTTSMPTFPIAAVGGAIGGVIILIVVIIVVGCILKRTRSFQVATNMPSAVEMKVASSNEKEGEYETIIDNFQNSTFKAAEYENVKFPSTFRNPPPIVSEYEIVTARSVVNNYFDISDCAAYGVTRRY